MKRFTILALAVALVLGVFVSPYASSHPDGLERVATDKGFLDAATSESTYGTYAGLTGTLLVFVVGAGLALRRR
jgi:hypothetical protein